MCYFDQWEYSNWMLGERNRKEPPRGYSMTSNLWTIGSLLLEAVSRFDANLKSLLIHSISTRTRNRASAEVPNRDSNLAMSSSIDSAESSTAFSWLLRSIDRSLRRGTDASSRSVQHFWLTCEQSKLWLYRVARCENCLQTMARRGCTKWGRTRPSLFHVGSFRYVDAD